MYLFIIDIFYVHLLYKIGQILLKIHICENLAFLENM